VLSNYLKVQIEGWLEALHSGQNAGHGQQTFSILPTLVVVCDHYVDKACRTLSVSQPGKLSLPSLLGK